MSISSETQYPLTSQQRAAFETEGFVRLPKVLSPEEIARYEPEITSKVVELNTMHLPLAERSTYDKAFLQVMNLWRHSAVAREMVFSPRLARIATELMGVRGVRLYHDQALYKEPGGGITPWHADLYYWPLDSHRACTVWIPLQKTPLSMGPLAFATGSHRLDLGRDLPISDASEERLLKALSARGVQTSYQPFELGDVSFHAGWTFHRAEANQTEIPRRVMTVIYMDADIRVARPIRPEQETDLAAFMPGVKVGDVPDSALNPILWSGSGLTDT